MGALLSLPLLFVPSMSTVRFPLPSDIPIRACRGANGFPSSSPLEPHVVEQPLVRPSAVPAANFRAGSLTSKSSSRHD